MFLRTKCGRALCALLSMTLVLCLAAGCGGAGEETVVDLGGLLDESVPLAGAPTLDVTLAPSAPGTATKANSSALVDYSNAADGYIMVKWTGGGSPKLKVLVKGPSCPDTYQYNLRTDGEYDTFPLSDGSGKYSVIVYKNR